MKKNKIEKIFFICLLGAAAAFICIGVLRGEAQTVLAKSVKICLECVGIG